MSELRTDPITGRQVYLAEERLLRPGAISPDAMGIQGPDHCPFCQGHESDTPEAVAIYPKESETNRDSFDTRPSNASGKPWTVRVVPNKYPVVIPGNTSEMLTGSGNEVLTGKQIKNPSEGLSEGNDFSNNQESPAFREPQGANPLSFARLPGLGAHEVVIEDPRHITRVGESTLLHQFDALCAHRDRLAYWQARDRRLSWGIAFRNVGAAAGASLEHLHSQLMVLPTIPPAILQEHLSASEYYSRFHRCSYCELLETAMNSSRRVAEDEDFVAFCPFVARMPYETWILPREHTSHFEQESDERLERLARFQFRLLSAIESLADLPGYNTVLHTAPFLANGEAVLSGDESVWGSEKAGWADDGAANGAKGRPGKSSPCVSHFPSASSSVGSQKPSSQDDFSPKCQALNESRNEYVTKIRFDTSAEEHYHWRIEVIPRQVKLAGFELGSSLAINPVSPERAATILRASVVSL